MKHLARKELADAIEQNKFIYDEYFDVPFGKALNEHLFHILAKVYFRSAYVNFEEFPQRNNPERPLIFASNHSGMAFPWDGIIKVSGLHMLVDYSSDAVRPLTSPMLSQSTLMNPFLIENLWKRVGSVDATFINFETMMQNNDYNLLIYPEGVPGIGKGFSKRYQLQRLSTSALRMSIKYKTDIIPIATINGEYINPYHYFWGWVNKLINKIGIPFLPIGPLTLLLLLQPWLFYYALPAKLTYVRGKRIRVWDENRSIEDYTEEEIIELRDQIHREMQAELSASVEKYGKSPYHWKSFFAAIWKHKQLFPFTMPFAWPLMFEEFYRQYKKRGIQGIKLNLDKPFATIRLLLRNPFVLSYYIPILGWIPIFIRGYRNAKLGKQTRKRAAAQRSK